MPRTERDIVIGKVIAPFGVRGEVKVIVLTDFPERLDAGRKLRAKPAKGEARTLTIDTSRSHKIGLVVKFLDVDSADSAEELRSTELVIDSSELGELRENSFYVFDLLGLKVTTEDGRDQGEIVEILQGGANDVYVTSSGLCIPALKDVVAQVDLEGGTMVIRAVPGLLPGETDAD